MYSPCWDQLLISIMTGFDASCNHRVEPTAQYSVRTSDRSVVARCQQLCVLYIAKGHLYLCTGLHKRRKRVKFGQRYSSEKVAHSLEGIRWIQTVDTLHIHRFSSPRKAPARPWISHNYFIDYTIITPYTWHCRLHHNYLITTEK
jgi:hypothetical protein